MSPPEDELRMLYLINLEAYGFILEHGHVPEVGPVVDGKTSGALELLDLFEKEAVRVELWDEAAGVTDGLLSTEKMNGNPAYALTCRILRQMSALLYLTAEVSGVLYRESQLWISVKENISEDPTAYKYFSSISSEALDFHALIKYLRQQNNLLESMVKSLQMTLADIAGLGEMAALKENISAIINTPSTSPSTFSSVPHSEQSSSPPRSATDLSPPSYSSPTSIVQPEAVQPLRVEVRKLISSTALENQIDSDETTPTDESTPKAQLSPKSNLTTPTILAPIQEEQDSNLEASEVTKYLLNFFHSFGVSRWKDFRSGDPQVVAYPDPRFAYGTRLGTRQPQGDLPEFSDEWKEHAEAWHNLNTKIGHGKLGRRRSWSGWKKRLRRRSRTRRASVGTLYDSRSEEDEVEEHLGFFDEWMPVENKISEQPDDDATAVSPTGAPLKEDQFGWAYLEK